MLLTPFTDEETDAQSGLVISQGLIAEPGLNLDCLVSDRSSMLWHVSVFHSLLLKNIPLQGYNTFYLPIHLDGRLGCFQTLAIMNNAIVNTHVSFFVDICFRVSWVGARNKFAESHGNSKSDHLRSSQGVFQAPAPFCVPNSSVWRLNPPCPCQHLSVFLIIAIVVGEK